MQISRNKRGDWELQSNSLPLSVPARRLLRLIASPSTIRTLVAHVRLGELGRHLRELERHDLIEVKHNDVQTHLNSASAHDASDTSEARVDLFPKLPAALVAVVKHNAMTLLEMHMGSAGLLLSEDIAAADSYEALLVALGVAQRALFDVAGKVEADEFATSVIQPLMDV
jgi:hypothetical protein